MRESNSKKQSICITSATPLTIHFFLLPHIAALSDRYELTVIFDHNNDSYLGDIGLSAITTQIKMNRKLSPLQDLISLFHLYQFFRKKHFDLVISVAPKAGFISMIASTFASSAKRIHIFQGEFWATKKGLLRLVLKQADCLTAFLADQVLAVSKSERNFLAHENIIRLEKVDVLGEGSIGGVDFLKFQFNSDARTKIRQSLEIPQDAVVALFVGRVVRDKGIFELVQAFANNYECSQSLYLLIVGPDEDKVNESLFSNLASVRDRVKSVGFTHTPEQYMSAADFFCLPSYREGFPISILEASAVGIPSIGTNIYGISDAIETDKTGILVAPRDVRELSEAMNLLYRDKSLRNYLGTNARARALSLFRQDIVVKRYIDYFVHSLQVKNLNPLYLAAKRAIDLVLSSFGLMVFFIPMVVIGIGVAVSSRGPVIFWADRAGKGNTFFRMAKFRTMIIATPNLATDLLENPDQFISPIGKFLRKSSIDELPQLWNILKGDMSFVGPRPALFNQASLIDARAKVGINSIRPGLTGWAQVNGRDEISEAVKVQFDIVYMQNASIFFDFKILCLTFLKVCRGDGVIH